jgi:uncharacterized protein
MGPKLILIDGYNVIRNTPGLVVAERVSIAHGRDSLLAQVQAKFLQTSHRVIVVFDGDGQTETRQALTRLPGGQVIYSRRGETADSVIQRLTAAEKAKNGGEIVVCTNDLAVQMQTAEEGASAAEVAEFMRAINAPPNGLRKRLQRSAYSRRQSELEAEGIYPQRPKKGNPRKAPKSQRGSNKPLRPW